MQPYRPTSTDLLAAVGEFLNALAPRLDAGDRYHALVCSHIIAMVRRELPDGPWQPSTEEARLAQAIRNGALDDEWDATLQAVLANIITRTGLVKPDHLAPVHQPA